MMPAQSQKASTSVTAAAVFDPRRSPKVQANFIDDEPHWRWKPPTVGASAPRVVATRWRSLEHGIREVSAETPSDGHTVAIVLRNENVWFSVSRRTVHDGLVTPGAFHVTEPAAPTWCVFRGPYDVLHLHVPNGIIEEISREFSDREPTPLCSQPALARDPMVERLARALLASEQIGGSYGRLYADSVSIAVNVGDAESK